MNQPTNRSGLHGFEVLKVFVDEVVHGDQFARCHDESGIEVQVPTGIRTGSGAWPQEGDTWLLTKQFGRWTFHSIIGENHPIVITAPRDTADELTEQLLDALVQLGLVVEERSLIPASTETAAPEDQG